MTQYHTFIYNVKEEERTDATYLWNTGEKRKPTIHFKYTAPKQCPAFDKGSCACGGILQVEQFRKIY